MATNEEILQPVSLTLPVVTPASTRDAEISGAILLSGAKLYFYNGAAWALVTSE